MDERLRAAVVSDRVRLGQLELELGTALRPKDIQSRIRSGERLEDVAAAAGVPPERIMTYAAPVLSERAHVATQARRSVLRRSEPTGPRALAEAVADRLHQRGVSASAVAWDAWRRDDGKWTVSAAYTSGRARADRAVRLRPARPGRGGRRRRGPLARRRRAPARPAAPHGYAGAGTGRQRPDNRRGPAHGRGERSVIAR